MAKESKPTAAASTRRQREGAAPVREADRDKKRPRPAPLAQRVRLGL